MDEVAELKHAAYWLSLGDRQPVPGAPETKVRVDVPLAYLHAAGWRETGSYGRAAI